VSLHAHDILATLGALAPAPRFWVAFSGGLDSSVLLHLLARHRGVLGAPLVAVHVDHGLLPEARAWTAHCQAACAALAVPLTVLRVDARAAQADLGVEAAARVARYRAFAGLLGEGECLLTAHHRDDQAETVLLQLLRGSGPAGLAAMPAVAPLGRGRLARPLLDLERAALRGYAAVHQIDYLVDPMNEDLGLGRGFLRAEVLPRLATRWPGVRETLARAARHAADAVSIIAERAAEDLAAIGAASAWQVSVSGLMRLPPPRRRAVLRHWCSERGIAMPDAARLDEVIRQIADARAERAPQVAWSGGAFRRYRDALHLTPDLPPHDPTARLPWDAAVALALPAGLGRLRVVPGGGLAPQTLQEGVEVRFRAAGLRCAPRGRVGRHTLKHLFQEAGVPPWLRDRIPLVFVDGELAAIADRWVCSGFGVAEGAPGVRIAWERPAHLGP
jgi:tRNA(Ile)-lysidine synthase